MKFRLLEPVRKKFRVEVPEDLDDMDQHLEWILPKVVPWSEDLRETQFFLNSRWLEISDNEEVQESLLHIFLPEQKYLVSVDGDISEGKWTILDGSNTLILERNDRMKELYNLAFLNNDFFILKKHGDQKRKNLPNYLVLGRETVVASLTWREVMEMLFNIWRNSSSYLLYVAIVGGAIALVLALSLLT